MDKMLKQYLDQAKEVIGERTEGEIAHDNAVVDALNSGLSIEAALSLAAQHHPGEAIQWDSGNIDDIAAHYDRGFTSTFSTMIDRVMRLFCSLELNRSAFFFHPKSNASTFTEPR